MMLLALVLSSCAARQQDISAEQILERTSYVQQFLSSAAYEFTVHGWFPTRAGVASGSITGTGVLFDGGRVQQLQVQMTGALLRASSSPSYDIRFTVHSVPSATSFRINQFTVGAGTDDDILPYLHQWWSDSVTHGIPSPSPVFNPLSFQNSMHSMQMKGVRFDADGVDGRPCYVLEIFFSDTEENHIAGELWIDSEEFILLHANYNLTSSSSAVLRATIDIGRVNDPTLFALSPQNTKVINPSHALRRFLPTIDILH